MQSEEKKLYDVIVLSLVINFEGDLKKRGDMLIKAQQLIKQNGHIFVSDSHYTSL